jgi:hypothetical protein
VTIQAGELVAQGNDRVCEDAGKVDLHALRV